VLSVFDGVMIITGVVIGGGIFALPPMVAGLAGSVPWMFVAWALGAVLALVGALCYAELAASYPDAGGDYHFLTRAYGRDVSFFFAWARIGVITTGSIALLAFVFGDYMSRVLPLGSHSSTVYAVAVVVVLTATNIAGLRQSARAQNLMSGLLVLGMLFVVAAGFLAPDPAPPTAAPSDAAAVSAPALAAFGTALLFVLFTYGGWNEAAYISAEVRGGRRAIVRVLVLALALVTLVYVLFVAALLAALGFDGLKASKAVAADVARLTFGGTGERLIGAIAALAALTSINATLLVSARTNYSLGADWRLFAFMNRWSGERDAPVAALLVTGALSLALVGVAALNQGGVKFLVEFTAPVFWFFFLLTGIALFVLRRRQPQAARPFAVPLYPLLPAVFVLTCAFLLYKSLQWALVNESVQIALYVMAAGVAVWLVARLARRA
jgi:amino acid transporter